MRQAWTQLSHSLPLSLLGDAFEFFLKALEMQAEHFFRYMEVSPRYNLGVRSEASLYRRILTISLISIPLMLYDLW